jgi:hypothetical protein
MYIETINFPHTSKNLLLDATATRSYLFNPQMALKTEKLFVRKNGIFVARHLPSAEVTTETSGVGQQSVDKQLKKNISFLKN